MTFSICSVTSQVVPLSNVDAYLSSLNSDIVLFFENISGHANFMDGDILRRAFYRTLQKFPIYLGYFRPRTDGGLEIAIDEGDLNTPNFTESTSDVSFADLKSSSFNPSTWPAGLMTTETFALPDQATGQIKLLNVHIVRFKESTGVALFVSGAHAVTDGTGFYSFIGHWANESRALLTGEPAPEISVTFDRGILVGDLTEERAELDPLTQFIYGTTSPAALAFSSLPVAERSYAFLAKMTENKLQGSLYRVNNAKLERLHKEVQKFAPHGIQLSLNDILVTLISSTLAQAKIASKTKLHPSGDLSDRKNLHLIGTVCNVRPRLGISEINYVGNAHYLALVANPIEKSVVATTPKILAEIAVVVRTSVAKVQAPQIRTCYDLYSENPEQFARITITRAMHGMQTIVSNQSRFRLYDIDFGNGAADFVICRPTRMLDVVTILPAHPPCKDVLVSITDVPAVMKNVCENEFWGTVAELVW